MSVSDLFPANPEAIPVQRGANPIITFQDEVNRLFNQYSGNFAATGKWPYAISSASACRTAIDIADDGHAFTVTAEMPGLEPGDILVSAAGRYVIIRGNKKEQASDTIRYCRHERTYGPFQRVLALPPSADTDEAVASLGNGLLTITIPRKTGASYKERRLHIRQAA